MAHGNEKGIILKLEGIVIEGNVPIHINTAIAYLESLRPIANEKGWVDHKLVPNIKRHKRCSHYLKPINRNKPDYRQTKITGPTQYKTA